MGLHKNSKKVDKCGRMQRFMIERGNPLCSVFSENLRRMAFMNLFSFVADRSFTADGGLL